MIPTDDIGIILLATVIPIEVQVRTHQRQALIALIFITVFSYSLANRSDVYIPTILSINWSALIMKFNSRTLLTAVASTSLLAGTALAHEVIHGSHAANHSADDGHMALIHDGHIDHVHDGHLHHMHDSHVDEHVIEISAVNWAGEARHAGDTDHMHSSDDGHNSVQHGDHFDHIHDGHLHHMHDDHTDEHGGLEVAE